MCVCVTALLRLCAPQEVVVNMIMAGVSNVLGIGAADFKLNHPSGTLGTPIGRR